MKIKLSKKAIGVLRKAKKAILERPDQVEMGDWFCRRLHFGNDEDNATTLKAGGCGTAGCIAGWIYHVMSGDKNIRATASRISEELMLRHFSEEALDALIPSMTDTYHQRSRLEEILFHIEGWPRQFRMPYEAATEPKKRARIVANRITHLIKTGQ